MIAPSLSFSGAGFLGCYHLGVASSLIKHGYLLSPGEAPDKNGLLQSGKRSPILLGASAGALTCAGILSGVNGEDAMQIILKIASNTREQGGLLDSLRPGYSLVDQLGKYMLPAMKKAINNDDDFFQRRLQSYQQGHHSILRIGLTSKNDILTQIKNKPNKTAYRYVDVFRDVEDVYAAAILSSFIPGITGPIKGAASKKNLAVKNCWIRLKDMIINKNAVKYGESGDHVRYYEDENVESVGDGVLFDSHNSNFGAYLDFYSIQFKKQIHSKLQYYMNNPEVYWDGGISNMWPVIDSETIVVTPLNGNFSPNPFIAPDINSKKDSGFMMRIDDRCEVGINLVNLEALRRISISSDDKVLEDRFKSGYDDCTKFLTSKSMLQVYSI